MNNQKKIFTSQASMTKEERELQVQYVNKMQTDRNLKQQAKKELELELELNKYNELKLYILNLVNREEKKFVPVNNNKLKKFLELEKKFTNTKDKEIKYYKGQAEDNKNSMDEYEEEITDMENEHKKEIELRNKRILKARELLKGKTKQINNYLIIFGIITSFLLYTTFATPPVVYQHLIILNSYLYPFLEFILDLIIQMFIFIFGDIYILLATILSIYIVTACYLEKWVIIDFDTSRRFRY